jgi:hypothetical protein
MAARGHCQCRWNQKITTVWPVRPQNIDRIYWISGNISAEMTSFDAFWSYLSLVVFDHSNGIQRVLAATITGPPNIRLTGAPPGPEHKSGEDGTAPMACGARFRELGSLVPEGPVAGSFFP